MLNKVKWRENEMWERNIIFYSIWISHEYKMSHNTQCDELYEKNKLKIYNKIIFILYNFKIFLF